MRAGWPAHTHAGACLPEGAVLVSHDRHFRGIREEGVVEVWTTSEALRRLEQS